MQYPYTVSQLAEELGMNYRAFKAWRWTYMKMGALPEYKENQQYCSGTTFSRKFSHKYLLVLKDARSKVSRRRKSPIIDNNEKVIELKINVPQWCDKDWLEKETNRFVAKLLEE